MFTAIQKYIVKFTPYLTLIVSLLVLLNSSQAQTALKFMINVPENDMHIYPITPDMEDVWASLSVNEMRELTQIPPDQLTIMSTRGVIQSVLDYPLLIDRLFFDTPQIGFNVVASRFNGLQELLSRTDAGVTLTDVYSEVSSRVEGHWTDTEQYDYGAKIGELEMFLAQEEILNSLTPEQRFDLLKIAYNHLQTKLDVGDSVYTIRQMIPVALLIGRIMNIDSEQFRSDVEGDDAAQLFLQDGSFEVIETKKLLNYYEQLQLHVGDKPESYRSLWHIVGLGTLLLLGLATVALFVRYRTRSSSIQR